MRKKSFHTAFLIAIALNLMGAESKKLSPNAAADIAGATKPKRLILAIGIDTFADSFWQGLKYPSQDARGIHGFLMSEAEIPFDGGELLSTLTAPDGKVTKDSVLKAFDRLNANNLSEDDTVIVYLSTHGTIFLRPGSDAATASRYTPYFVTADTNHKNIQGTAIARDDLIEAFQGLKSQRKALIIATCHSGGGKAQLTPEIKKAISSLKAGASDEEAPVRSGKGYAILAAASWSEPAEEDDALGHDVYTYFLLQGMRQKRDVGSAMTLSQAHDFATRATIAHTGNRQHPTIRIDQAGGDPIVIAGTLSGGGIAYLYAYLNKLTHFSVRIAGESKGLPLDSGPVTVQAGKRRIDIINTETNEILATRVVRFEEGKEYAVSDLIQPERDTHVDMALPRTWFLAGKLSEQYAPNAASGIVAALGVDDRVGVFDVVAQIGFYPWQNERVRVDGRSFAQKRSMLRGFLGLGSHERFRLYRTQEHTFRAEWHWQTGAAILGLRRQILGDEAAAFDKSSDDVVLPGVGARFGFGLSSSLTGLRAGFEGQVDTFLVDDRLNGTSNVATVASLVGYVGLAW